MAFPEQNSYKKTNDNSKGYNCKNWTKEQCETVLFVDIWDTLKDLDSRVYNDKVKDTKEVFEKLKELCYFNLSMVAKGATIRAFEIAKELNDMEFLQKIRNNKKLLKKKGLV